MNFKDLWLFMKIFSSKFGGVASFGDTSEHFTKVFSHESFPLCIWYLNLTGPGQLYGVFRNLKWLMQFPTLECNY